MTKEIREDKRINQAKGIFELELTEIKEKVIPNIDIEFSKAIDIIQNSTGKVVVIGMGKSGLIGAKIAATFASTGTPSFSLHPGEALHGDLGMIEKCDVVLMLSYSGETEEMLKIIPSIKNTGCRIISITGNDTSNMSVNSDANLNVNIENEACPNNLAPTTSTTAQLIMGDALAIVLMEESNFKPLDFARYHPGGSLGRKLLKKVKDEMFTKRLPFVKIDKDIKTLILTMSNSNFGLAIIVNNDNKMVGIVTDGDLRRAWNDYDSLKLLSIEDIMTKEPTIAYDTDNIHEAELIMRDKKINNIIVLNDVESPVGILQIFN